MKPTRTPTCTSPEITCAPPTNSRATVATELRNSTPGKYAALRLTVRRFASRFVSLSSPNRARWRGSWWNARTTRIPDSVSWRYAVIAPIVSRVRREGPAPDPDPRQRLREGRRDRADRLARAAVGVGARDAERERPGRHHREDQERDERELHVEREQDHDRADERERRLEQRHDRVRHERVERFDVVRHPRDQHAGRAALVEADRHVLEVAEDLHPQVRERALADPADEERLQEC